MPSISRLGSKYRSNKLEAPPKLSGSSLAPDPSNARFSVWLHRRPEVCSGVNCRIAELFFDPQQLQQHVSSCSEHKMQQAYTSRKTNGKLGEAWQNFICIPGCIWLDAQTGRELLSWSGPATNTHGESPLKQKRHTKFCEFKIWFSWRQYRGQTDGEVGDEGVLRLTAAQSPQKLKESTPFDKC